MSMVIRTYNFLCLHAGSTQSAACQWFVCNGQWLMYTFCILFPCLLQSTMKAQGPVHLLVKLRKAWNSNECTSHAWEREHPSTTTTTPTTQNHFYHFCVSRRYFHHANCSNLLLQLMIQGGKGPFLMHANWMLSKSFYILCLICQILFKTNQDDHCHSFICSNKLSVQNCFLASSYIYRFKEVLLTYC